MKLKIDIKGEGLKTLSKNLVNFNVKTSIDKFLLTAGEISEKFIKIALTTGSTRAIKTGLLRNSVRVNAFSSGKFIKIGDNVSYGFFVHEGTRYMRKRTFLVAGVKFAKMSFDSLAKDTGVEMEFDIVKNVQ